jgi:hypothetical protein
MKNIRQKRIIFGELERSTDKRFLELTVRVGGIVQRPGPQNRQSQMERYKGGSKIFVYSLVVYWLRYMPGMMLKNLSGFSSRFDLVVKRDRFELK